MNRTDGPLLVGGQNENTNVAKPLLLDNSGNLKVAVTGAGSGGTSSVDESGFTPGASAGTPAMGVYEATPTTLIDGQLGIVAVNANRELKVEVTAGGGSNASVSTTGTPVPASATYIGRLDGSGNLAGLVSGAGTAATALRVELPTDGTGVLATVGAVTSITNPVAVTGPLTDTQLRATAVPVSLASAPSTSVTQGTSPWITAGGGTAGTAATGVATIQGIASMTPVQVSQATASNLNATIVGTGTLSVQTSAQVPGTGATNLGKAEDNAHTSGDVGVFALAVRNDSPDTAVSNTAGDYTQVSVSSTGAVRNAPISEDFAALANGPQVKKYYSNAGAVTDGIVWSPAAGKRWYVTDIFVGVSAAATVTLEDDLSGGDSAVWKMELAANSGWAHAFNTPLFSGEDAADLLVTTSAGNVYITITGYEI